MEEDMQSLRTLGLCMHFLILNPRVKSIFTRVYINPVDPVDTQRLLM